MEEIDEIITSTNTHIKKRLPNQMIASFSVYFTLLWPLPFPFYLKNSIKSWKTFICSDMGKDCLQKLLDKGVGRTIGNTLYIRQRYLYERVSLKIRFNDSRLLATILMPAPIFVSSTSLTESNVQLNDIYGNESSLSTTCWVNCNTIEKNVEMTNSSRFCRQYSPLAISVIVVVVGKILRSKWSTVS